MPICTRLSYLVVTSWSLKPVDSLQSQNETELYSEKIIMYKSSNVMVKTTPTYHANNERNSLETRNFTFSL